MAEIKSTLDLVLEKTKNLKMTEEERKKQKEKEMRGKIKGIIQQYLDGILTFETIQNDPAAKRLFESEALEKIDPEGTREDNHKILNLLEIASPAKRAAVLRLLEDWESVIRVERDKYTSKIKAQWATSGLTGTALIPNPANDASWLTFLEKKRAEFKIAIRSLETAP